MTYGQLKDGEPGLSNIVWSYYVEVTCLKEQKVSLHALGPNNIRF
jgi:hypothetical protein